MARTASLTKDRRPGQDLGYPGPQHLGKFEPDIRQIVAVHAQFAQPRSAGPRPRAPCSDFTTWLAGTPIRNSARLRHGEDRFPPLHELGGHEMSTSGYIL
jgi:hypothetical protein